MCAILDVVFLALNFYWVIVIASALFSWLYAFNIVNSSNQFVATIGRFLYQMTEPALRPIRRYMPDLGGIDISPIVLLFGLYFVEIVLRRYVYSGLDCANFGF